MPTRSTTSAATPTSPTRAGAPGTRSWREAATARRSGGSTRRPPPTRTRSSSAPPSPRRPPASPSFRRSRSRLSPASDSDPRRGEASPLEVVDDGVGWRLRRQRRATAKAPRLLQEVLQDVDAQAGEDGVLPQPF